MGEMMRIKIVYETLDSKPIDDQARALGTLRTRVLGAGLAWEGRTYEESLKALASIRGLMVDERERLIPQPAIFGEIDQERLGELENALRDIPGVRVEPQNDYRAL